MLRCTRILQVYLRTRSPYMHVGVSQLLGWHHGTNCNLKTAVSFLKPTAYVCGLSIIFDDVESGTLG
jgi:hypothetical protein